MIQPISITGTQYTCRGTFWKSSWEEKIAATEGVRCQTKKANPGVRAGLTISALSAGAGCRGMHRTLNALAVAQQAL